jgi:hypothetical protein
MNNYMLPLPPPAAIEYTYNYRQLASIDTQSEDQFIGTKPASIGKSTLTHRRHSHKASIDGAHSSIIGINRAHSNIVGIDGAHSNIVGIGI